MTIALMLNRKAGVGRTKALVDYLFQQLDSAGINYIVVEGNSAEDAIEKASAIAHQVKAVVAVGGDGSVHTAAQVAWKHSLPLGVIASGSGDDVARACGLPHGRNSDATRLAVDHFVTAWQEQDFSHIDALEVITGDENSHVVLAVLSCGFDSRVNANSSKMTYLKGTFRYVVAMLKTLTRFTPIEYTITIDGEHQELRAMLVAVGNGSMFGGGMKVLPDAKVDDGELDILIVHPVSIPTLLRIFPRIFKGTHVFHHRVNAHRAKQIHMHAPGEQVWGDGEYLGPTPARINLQAGRIAIFGARL
jgi:diacylglycerol kinase (ATP)